MKKNIEKYYLPPNSNLDLDSNFEQPFLWKRFFLLLLIYTLLDFFCMSTVIFIEINFFVRHYFGNNAIYVSKVLVYFVLASIQRTNKIKYFGLLALCSWVFFTLSSHELGYPLPRFLFFSFIIFACAALGGFIGDKIFKPKLT